MAAAGLPVSGVRFERVRFRYPGADRDVSGGLDLVLRAGQSTALVGINGAGKTTLVKLLAGMGRPLPRCPAATRPHAHRTARELSCKA